MEEMMVSSERPGFFSRMMGRLYRTEEPEEATEVAGASPVLQINASYRYTVTVRRHITSFDDAVAAANGLKAGEQQILNLTDTEATLRQKVVDFMCGVSFAREGTWENIGEHIYLIAPANAYIEVAPASARQNAVRN